jgi:transposase
MEKKLFISIDFSKKTMAVSVIGRDRPEEVNHCRFANSREGCSEARCQWIKSQSRYSREKWLFCGEHTGLYSLPLSEFLIKKGLFLWLENPLQIKLSTGIRRDKNDRTDSRDIALYALRFRDKARCCQLPDAALKSLELLLSFRERLLRNKHSLRVSSKEIHAVIQRDKTARYVYEQSQKDVERINREMEDIETKMMELIESSESMKENYALVSSIKGVAMINTVAILIATQNFTRFDNSRQFACYAGMAPFGKESGTSIKTGPHVSHLADKKIKVLLTQAALCAVKHDSNIKRYYQRKKEEGKNERLILNNVRNKLIHRIFALVRNRRLYQVEYAYPSDKTSV